MKLFEIICVLLFLCGSVLAEDLIFFADDHYKALGRPLLNASAANPSLLPGDSVVLRINLANFGQLEELIPINGNGSKDDIRREMEEEMHSIDALNIKADLQGTKALNVTTGPKLIESLSGGAVVELQFNVTVEKGANGWYELPLRLDYERSADVSVSDGVASPLYLPENRSINIRILVAGASDPLRVVGTKSELFNGANNGLIAVIKNDYPDTLHNCSARLITEPPFHAESGDYFLGDLPSGGLGTASFVVRVDGDATLQDYQLGCIVNCSERRTLVALPLALTKAENSIWPWALPILSMLTIAALAAFLLLKRRILLQRYRRRRR
ncbi:MAG: hypothetical protein LUQ44_07800 [Methanothrix sp.]|nr:hypothetical protein [Methanothrix sp.]